MNVKECIRRLIYRIRGEYTVEQLKKIGLNVGKNFDAQIGFEIDPSHCWLITIGDNVTFAPHVQILAHDASTCKTNGHARIGKVIIGDNVFIGAGSIVLPNVTIGSNTIIGAGSVVVHSIPDNSVAVGNPARIISTTASFKERNDSLMKRSPVYNDEYTLRKGITRVMKDQQIKELDGVIGYVK